MEFQHSCSLYLTLGLVIAFCLMTPVDSAIEGGTNFKNTIQQFTQASLFYTDLENNVRALSSGSKPIDGATLVRQSAQKIDDALEFLKLAVEKNAAKAIDAVANPSCDRPPLECKDFDPTGAKDRRFGQVVDVERACFINYNASTSRNLSCGELTQFRGNYVFNQPIRWQYTGFETGDYTNYPAFHDDTDDYDPRFRPWYVDAVTKGRKTVLIVVDTSNRINIVGYQNDIRQAIKTTLGTLQTFDKFNVVQMAESTHGYPEGCLSSEMAFATPNNIDTIINEFVNKFTYAGTTQYGPAIDKAFDYLEKEANMLNTTFYKSRASIIFITASGDLASSGNSSVIKLMERNNKLKNHVVFIPIGLGITDQDTINLLTSLGKQRSVALAMPSVVVEPALVASEIRDNGLTLSQTINKAFRDVQWDQNMNYDPHFVTPYFDVFGIGLVYSVCKPLIHNQTRLGVTCIEMDQVELFQDLVTFSLSKTSYVFMVTDSLLALYHPLLPTPSNGTVFQLTKVELLEPEAAAKGLFTQLERSDSGFLRIANVSRAFSLGDVRLEGIKTRNIATEYYWKRIPAFNSTLVVAIAVNESTVEFNKVRTDNVDFIYHRFDLLDEDEKPKFCNHFSRQATIDSTSVKFTVAAMKDPSKYRFELEDPISVKRYESDVKGARPTARLKENVGPIMNLTGLSNKLYKNRDANPFSKFIIWQYLSTITGLLRVFPGIGHENVYDHATRPWFQRALATDKEVSLTVPYTDKWGSGLVSTFSRAFGDADGRIVGVVAADVTMNSVYHLIISEVPRCSNDGVFCFLVDDTGFILMHKDFFNLDLPPDFITNPVHITQKEPAIAKLLIDAKIMQCKSCKEVFKFGRRRYWNLYFNGDYDHPSGLTMTPIPGTNFILGLANEGSQDGPCDCGIIGEDCPRRSNPGCTCRCPCFDESVFNQCTGTPTEEADADEPVCIPQLIDRNPDTVFTPDPTLPECYERKCSSYRTENDCFGVSGCNWCYRNVTGNNLQCPFCADMDTCDRGVANIAEEDTSCNEGPPEESSQGSLAAAIAVPIVLIIIVAIALAVGFYFYRKKHEMQITEVDKPGPPPPSVHDLDPSNSNPASHGVQVTYTPRPHVYESIDDYQSPVDNYQSPVAPSSQDTYQAYGTAGNSAATPGLAIREISMTGIHRDVGYGSASGSIFSNAVNGGLHTPPSHVGVTLPLYSNQGPGLHEGGSESGYGDVGRKVAQTDTPVPTPRKSSTWELDGGQRKESPLYGL